MVFSRPGPTFLQQPAAGAASSQQQSSQQQSSQQSRSRYRASLVYRAVSDDMLGSFWSLFPGSSVLQCHGFSRPGPTFLQQPAAGAARAASSRVASSQEAGSRQPVVSSQDSASGGSQSSAARTQHPGASLVYRAVSDDTLGSFWSLFPGPSVLQCHGVFPSGTCVFAAASE